jgi:formylglycine-generating enzyme required for sulfatase activity
VTWGEWKEVRDWAVNNNKGYDLAGVGGTFPDGSGDNFPVCYVSWYDVVKWCNAKSEKEGKTAVYLVSGLTYKTGQNSNVTQKAGANGYRLPSEAEWERAARGGVSSQGYTYSGSNDANAVAWTYENSSNGTKGAGTKSGNELGIYDMSGNVWEWCWDVYNPYISSRRIRGGSWDNSASGATVSYRAHNRAPDYRYNSDGFRPACSSGGPPTPTPSAEMVTVQGGTLPSSSQLAGQTVGTFQIGKYEVTWGEWQKVRAWALSNGYNDLSMGGGQRALENHPVGDVSWYDVLKWCNARSEKDGLVPVYTVYGSVYRGGEFGEESGVVVAKTGANGYRLPTEPEWEWAARGGTLSQGQFEKF